MRHGCQQVPAQTKLFLTVQHHSLSRTPLISPMSSRHSCCLSVLYTRTIYKTTVTINCCRIGRLPDRQELFTASNVPRFVYGVFLLFLTLPVTVATAERSFSKLKLIKTYLRNTMQQDRLSGLISGLAILSTENGVALQLDVRKIIDDFASRKARLRRV